MALATPKHSVKDLASKAIQANKDHQYALKIYTERLEAELQTVDKLLASADVASQEDEPDLDVGGFVIVPGAKKAVSPIPTVDLLSHESPFYDDAERRSRYLNFTSIHPMKAKELEALAEAVRTENCRKQAFDAKLRGQHLASFESSGMDVETNKEGLDWTRIAEKVSEVSCTTRSPKECEIRWLGDRHPHFNHASWSQAEISRLRTIVSELRGQQVNWVQIAKEFDTNRTPIDCMRHGVQRMSHIWTPESDNRLVECIKVYGLENWNMVAKHVSEDVTAAGCQSRYYRTLDPTLKRGSWTTEEDEKLRRAVAVYDSSWVEVAAVIPGRNNDQCRDRWTDCLNPTLVKGKWTAEEDLNLTQAFETLGGKWKEISERLGNGRTDSMCRARYDVLAKRKPKKRAVRPSRSQSGAADQAEVPRQPQPSRSRPRPRPRKAPSAAQNIDPDNVVQPSPMVAHQTEADVTTENRVIGSTEVGREDIPSNSKQSGMARKRTTLGKRDRAPPTKRNKITSQIQDDAEAAPGSAQVVAVEPAEVNIGEGQPTTSSPRRKQAKTVRPSLSTRQSRRTTTSTSNKLNSTLPPVRWTTKPNLEIATSTPVEIVPLSPTGELSPLSSLPSEDGE